MCVLQYTHPCFQKALSSITAALYTRPDGTCFHGLSVAGESHATGEYFHSIHVQQAHNVFTPYTWNNQTKRLSKQCNTIEMQLTQDKENELPQATFCILSRFQQLSYWGSSAGCWITHARTKRHKSRQSASTWSEWQRHMKMHFVHVYLLYLPLKLC